MSTPTPKLKRSGMTPFNPVVRKYDVIYIAPSPCSSPRKERLTSLKGASYSATQHPLRLRARANIGKAKKFVNEVREIIHTGRVRRANGTDDHRGFDYELNLYKLAEASKMLKKFGLLLCTKYE